MTVDEVMKQVIDLPTPDQWTVLGRMYRRLNGRKPSPDLPSGLEKLERRIRALTWMDQSRLGERAMRQLWDEPEPERDFVEEIRASLEAEHGKDYRPRPIEESLAAVEAAHERLRERLGEPRGTAPETAPRTAFVAPADARPYDTRDSE